MSRRQSFWLAIKEQDGLAASEAIRIALNESPELLQDRDDEYGEDPVFSAIRHGNQAALQELLSRGAPADQLKNVGASVLHWAVIHNQPALIQLLWKKGASIDARRKSDDFTPLMLAAKLNNERLVKELLGLGASAHLIDSRGRTALDIAVAAQTTEDDEILDFFTDHGPDNPEDLDDFFAYEKVAKLLAFEEEIGPIDTSMPTRFVDKFKDSLSGVQFFVGGAGLMGIGVSQAITGWISNTVFARVLYGILGTLLGLPLAVVGLMLAIGVWIPPRNKPSGETKS